MLTGRSRDLRHLQNATTTRSAYRNLRSSSGLSHPITRGPLYELIERAARFPRCTYRPTHRGFVVVVPSGQDGTGSFLRQSPTRRRAPIGKREIPAAPRPCFDPPANAKPTGHHPFPSPPTTKLTSDLTPNGPAINTGPLTPPRCTPIFTQASLLFSSLRTRYLVGRYVPSNPHAGESSSFHRSLV